MLKWKRVGPNYTTLCGKYIAKHTGTAGKSTRMFTGYRTSDNTQVGNSGGLNKIKAACESDCLFSDIRTHYQEKVTSPV